MIHLVTYSAPNCSVSRETCVQAAHSNGVPAVYQYTPEDIGIEFGQFNKEILSTERGVGYWLWKPYFIHRALEWCNDGDILIYCDAGVKLINNVSHIFEVMDQDIFLFSNGHQHVHWCKADVLFHLLRWEYPFTFQFESSAIYGKAPVEGGIIDISSYQQAQASVIFFKVNQNTRNFIKEWLLWCQMPGFIDDSPSKLPNHPEFAQHRYDQAILTCLQIKYGYKLHWWADARWYESQRYRWPDDKYPSMFYHHRYRNKGEGKGEIEWP